MKYIITGYYDKQNYGDDLFKQVALQLSDKMKESNKVDTKIIPIDKLLDNDDVISYDRLVLFGGETLNDYFLNILINFKNKLSMLHANNIKMIAVGVSCNQEYSTLINKIQLFEYVSFRSVVDYDFFKTYIDCEYCPDIIMTLKPVVKPLDKNKDINILKKKNKTIGFFLSQTSIFNKSILFIHDYINTIVEFIKFLIENNYTIALFSMCINTIESESDLIINSMVYDLLSKKEKDKVIYYKSTDDILKNISTMSYTVCWRYHAHILSIINDKPFISISETPKVKALLNDNNLMHLYVDIENNVDNLIQSHYKLVNNKNYNKHKLLTVYNNCHAVTTKHYFDTSIYFKERSGPFFYISDSNMDVIYTSITNKYTASCDTGQHGDITDPLDKAMLIIFLLMRTIKNDYTHGLSEKIKSQNITNIHLIKDDIQWLINDCIKNKNKMFYDTILQNKQVYNFTHKYNFNYMDQDNYKGLHRSGWSYVVEHLCKNNNNTQDAILCDLYLDRTFHWNNKELSLLQVIPYTKAWIGFIHHTCETDYSDYNTTGLFKNSNFIKSLPYCKGLYVLSTYLKTCVETLLSAVAGSTNVKVFKLTHPTEFIANDKCFDMKAFINKNKNKNDRKIIQVGAWLRNLDAINQLNLNKNELSLQKCVLKCKNMNVYYHDINKIKNKNTISNISSNSISRDTQDRRILLNNDVTIIENLNNDEYDVLLSKNIVFINLINASAVNTIIECIVRNTPIIVNRLPATVELLGESYPLFYTTIADATDLLTVKKIKEGWSYLQKMDKTEFKIETFISQFNSR
jgi:polysaccharide pyruvyl transferase WcaK-like protein